MPKEVFNSDYRFLRHSDLLTFEEIARLAAAFVQHGVEKIRLTGGEPLLRKDLQKLIAMLSPMKTRGGNELDIALTTNGSVLARKARQLADAGLKRITVSLDGLDDATFRRMNDVDFRCAMCLKASKPQGPLDCRRLRSNGRQAWRQPNESSQWRVTFAAPPYVRFIEYMDVGTSNGWRLEEVVPSSDVLHLTRGISTGTARLQLHGRVAERWRYQDGQARSA